MADPNLWHLNRRSVSLAFAVGLFCAFMPIPFQMVLAGLVAIMLRVNLPIAVVMVWVSNPFTIPPLFYFAYKIGTLALGMEPLHFSFELSLHWLGSMIGEIWAPLLLGCFIVGSISALLGYFIVLNVWRWHIWGQIEKRKTRG